MSILAPSSSSLTNNAVTRAALLQSITKPLPQWAHRVRPNRPFSTALRCSLPSREATSESDIHTNPSPTSTPATRTAVAKDHLAASAAPVYPQQHQHQQRLQPASTPKFAIKPPPALARSSRGPSSIEPRHPRSDLPHGTDAAQPPSVDPQAPEGPLPPHSCPPHFFDTIKRQTFSDAAIDEALASFRDTLGDESIDEHSSALLALDAFLNSLPEHGRDPSTWRQSETAITWRLYERSLELYARSRPKRLSPSVDHVISRLCRTMMASKRLQHASKVTHVILDPRLRRSRVRFLFRRATWGMRVVASNLCSPGQGPGATASAFALLEAWRRTVETLLDRRVLSAQENSVTERAYRDSEGGQSSDLQALSYFLVLLAQFGSPECALRFASKLHRTSSPVQRLSGESSSIASSLDQTDREHRSGADGGLTLTGDGLKRTLEHLISRGYCDEAASIFHLADAKLRCIDCYTLLIKHSSKADELALHTADPLPQARHSPLRLWPDAIRCAEAQPPQTRSATLLQLFQARLHAHAKLGDPVSVVRDVREMKRRKLLVSDAAHGKRRTSLSSLSYAAQMSAVVAHLKAGKWTNAKRLALMLIEDDRRVHPVDCPDARRLHHQTALFNTLLSWARSSPDAIPQDWKGAQWQPSRSTRHQRRQTQMSFAQLEAFRFRLHELIDTHHCQPDAITRTIILQALLWWDKSSFATAPGSAAMRDLLVQTGLFEWAEDAASSSDGSAPALGRVRLAYHDDPRGYLHRGQRLLETLAHSFQANGFDEEAGWLLAELEEARRAARAATMSSRKERYHELKQGKQKKSERKVADVEG